MLWIWLIWIWLIRVVVVSWQTSTGNLAVGLHGLCCLQFGVMCELVNLNYDSCCSSRTCYIKDVLMKLCAEKTKRSRQAPLNHAFGGIGSWNLGTGFSWCKLWCHNVSSFSCLFYGNYFHLYIASWSFSELRVMPVLPERLICRWIYSFCDHPCCFRYALISQGHNQQRKRIFSPCF